VLGTPSQAVAHDLLPDEIAVAFDHGMRRAVRVCFLRKQRGVNPAVDDPGTALARQLPYFVSAARIAGMNSDAHDVAWLDGGGIDRIERFVNDDRVAPFSTGGGGQHIQPSRCDDRHAKRYMARIEQVDASTHSSAGLSRGRNAYVLGARAADRIIEQFKRNPLAYLKIPELAQKIRLVEKDITARCADDAAALAARQRFDAPFRDLASVDRLRRANMRRRRHRTPFQESGLPSRKAAHCSFRKLDWTSDGQSLACLMRWFYRFLAIMS
jgi:hypothetical protein